MWIRSVGRPINAEIKLKDYDLWRYWLLTCGSTSIKAASVDPNSGSRYAVAKITRLGTPSAVMHIGDETVQAPSDHTAALDVALPKILGLVKPNDSIACVGHRIVHGGDAFTSPVVVTDEIEKRLESLSELAPLHNPVNLAGVRAAKRLVPNTPHIAVFDTAFHYTLPKRARSYALPKKIVDQYGIHRYGFHGTSHRYVANRAANFLQEEIQNLRIVTCHLGGGCSVCAVEYGRSVETSMGMTPLEGLVMGTRAGDTDPGVLIHLLRNADLSTDELDDLLNRDSGLAGMSGVGNDFRDIQERAESGDEDCRLALQVFCHRVRKYIGAYAAAMGGVDAIVFTAGIGENSSVARHRIVQRFGFLGARIDEQSNRDAQVSAESPVVEISERHSRVKILVVATDEFHAIARQAEEHHRTLHHATPDLTIPVAISARHVHLTQESVELLFGKGHQLTPLKDLSQPGQFAAQETVTLVGPKRSIEGVRVLGPTRQHNQVEISRTDEFHLGIDAPVRASGQIDNTPGITLVGSEDRQLALTEGVICAWRHIHMTPDDAAQMGVSNGDVVEVEVGQTGGRSLVFGDVLVRVKPTYALEMHIDTDEGNAAELESRDAGELCATAGRGTIQGRKTR